MAAAAYRCHDGWDCRARLERRRIVRRGLTLDKPAQTPEGNPSCNRNAHQENDPSIPEQGGYPNYRGWQAKSQVQSERWANDIPFTGGCFNSPHKPKVLGN